MKKTNIAGMLEIDRLPGRKKVPQRWIILAIMVAVVVIIALFFWIRSNSSTAVQYKTEEVKRGNLTVIVTATGTFETNQQRG